MTTLAPRGTRWCAWLLALLVCAFLAGPTALADDDDPPPDDPAPEEPAPSDDDAERPDVHKLYVPFKDLAEVFEREGEGVFLPYAEFKKLWDKAYQVEPDRSKPPVPATVRSATYVGATDGNMIRFEAELDVEVLAEGWHRVPLDFRGIGIEEATIDGERALLVPAAEGYELLVKDPGRRTLSLVLRASAPATADTHSAEFRLPKVPLARMTLTVPGADTEVAVAPRLASSTRTTDAGDTELLAFLGPVEQVTLTWRRRPDDGPTIDPMVFAAERVTVRVDRGVVRTSFHADLSILRAPLEGMTVRVPADAVVLYVQGEGIRTWSRSADGTSIAIELREPAKERYAFDVGVEKPLGDLPLQVDAPLVALDGMERETGFLRLEAAEGVKIEPGDTAGLIQIDLQQMPEPLRAAAQGRAFFYRFPDRPGRLSVAVEALAPRITAEVGNRVGIRSEAIEVRAVARLTVERAGIFGATFVIVGELEVTDLALTGVELDDWRQTPDPDGGSRLEVAFRDRLLGQATIVVHGRAQIDVPDEDGKELEQVVPLVTLSDATHVRGFVAAHIESALDRREVTKTGLTVLDGATAAAIEPPGLPQTGESPLPLVYRFEHRDGPTALTLGLKRKAPMITAVVANRVTLEPDRTKVEPSITWNVAFRGVDTFRFKAPLQDEIARRLKLADTSLELLGPVAETKPEDVNGDWEPHGIWTVKLPAPRTGSIHVVFVVEDLEEQTLTSGAERLAHVPSFVPVRADESPLPNTVHYVAVQRDALLEVTPEQVDGAEEIDTRELPAGMQDTANFLAFRSYDATQAISIRVTKHDYEPVAALVIQHMHLDTVVARGRRATTEAYLVVRNNDRQFLELRLPPGAKLRAVRVGDTLKTPRKGEDGTVLIPLFAGLEKDEAFVVAMVYDHDIDHDDGTWETFTVRSPEPVGDVKSDLLTWRVFAPSELEYTSFGGSVERVDPERSWAQNLLVGLGNTFFTQDQGRRTEFGKLLRGYESPFQTKHEGREFRFHGRVGQGTVELSGVEPDSFTFWKLIWFLVALAGAFVAMKFLTPVGLTPLRTFGVLALVLLALMVPAGIGFGQVLSVMLSGVVAAGFILCVRWGFARGSAAVAAHREARATKAAAATDAASAEGASEAPADTDPADTDPEDTDPADPDSDDPDPADPDRAPESGEEA